MIWEKPKAARIIIIIQSGACELSSVSYAPAAEETSSYSADVSLITIAQSEACVNTRLALPCRL